MSSLLHDELEALAGSNAAAYISTKAFARLTLDRLRATIELLKDKEISSGTGQLSACLHSVTWSGQPNLSLAQAVAPVNADRELDIVVSPGFEAIVELFVTGDRQKIISELRLGLADIRVHLHATDNALILEGSDFKATRTITRNPDADQRLTDAKIDPLEAARVEGHISYGVVTQAASSALSRRSEFSFSKIFPAFNFGTGIKLKILGGGEAIGIIPTSMVLLVESSQCACGQGPDFNHSRTDIQKIVPPDPQPNDEVGKVTFGGPIADNKDPLKDFGLRGKQDRISQAGVYIPRTFASAMVMHTMPAIKVVASDNGTIGFRAEANVGFEKLALSFDIAGGGILLDIDLDISVSAYCDMELFKGLRLPIGWAIISPTNGGKKASLQIGFYPSIDSTGTIRLKATLKKSDMGSYVAVVIGIGTALKLLGVTAWIGFLVDVVLAAILSNGLPIALKKAISEHIANSEWKLIDGLPIVDQSRGLYPYSPFHTKTDSILVGIELDG